jgi:hypothetical protein
VNNSIKKTFYSWITVLVCSIIIFSTIPFAFSIQAFVTNIFGKSIFFYLFLITIVSASAGVFFFLIFKLKVHSASNYLWLIAISSIYFFSVLKFCKNPIETIHFLEYGILGFFLFKALSNNVHDRSIYFTAMFFGLFIGTIDELIQWTIPKRLWDFRDVGLNALSGVLFQLAIWKVIRPEKISHKITAKSSMIFTAIFSSCLIFFGLCASNTPERVEAYSNKIPILNFLQKEEAMSEFGYKFKDEEIGEFKSRMSLRELNNTDRMNAEQYAQILNQSAKTKYDQFIREYNPITNPFLHEMRVHIFRRDTYLNKSRSATDENEKKEAYFIAYKENLILEKYFGNTLRKTDHAWDENKKKEAEAYIEKNKVYRSPVSANLITSFSEKTIWIGILGIIVFLAGINFFFFLKEKREKVIFA